MFTNRICNLKKFVENNKMKKIIKKRYISFFKKKGLYC